MPDQTPQPAPVDEKQAALESLVGDLPAFKQATDTGQGLNIPGEGVEANEFMNQYVPAPPAGAKPAGQPVSDAPAPSTQSGGRLFAGKYRSVDEMERGYTQLKQEFDKRNQENLVLKAAQLATENIVGRQPRVEPTPPPAFYPVEFQGERPVVPVNQLRQDAVNAAVQAARETVSSILTPMQQLGAATTNLRGSYPEFGSNESAFASWLSANPRYQDLIQRDPDVGLESAYLKYQRDSGTVQTAQARETAIAAQQQVEQARSQAAPAGGVAPATRKMNDADARVANIERLYKTWQESGRPEDKKRLAHYILEQGVGDQTIQMLERSQWGR